MIKKYTSGLKASRGTKYFINYEKYRFSNCFAMESYANPLKEKYVSKQNLRMLPRYSWSIYLL